MNVKKDKKGVLKFHWKPSKKLDSVYEYLVRGFKVEAFSKSKGWHLRKRQPKRDNPVSILRDLFIRAGRYPADSEERAGWDKTLGDLYLYAEEKVDGIFVDERIKLRRKE